MELDPARADLDAVREVPYGPPAVAQAASATPPTRAEITATPPCMSRMRPNASAVSNEYTAEFVRFPIGPGLFSARPRHVRLLV